MSILPKATKTITVERVRQAPKGKHGTVCEGCFFASPSGTPCADSYDRGSDPNHKWHCGLGARPYIWKEVTA